MTVCDDADAMPIHPAVKAEMEARSRPSKKRAAAPPSESASRILEQRSQAAEVGVPKSLQVFPYVDEPVPLFKGTDDKEFIESVRKALAHSTKNAEKMLTIANVLNHAKNVPQKVKDQVYNAKSIPGAYRIAKEYLNPTPSYLNKQYEVLLGVTRRIQGDVKELESKLKRGTTLNRPPNKGFLAGERVSVPGSQAYQSQMKKFREQSSKEIWLNWQKEVRKLVEEPRESLFTEEFFKNAKVTKLGTSRGPSTKDLATISPYSPETSSRGGQATKKLFPEKVNTPVVPVPAESPQIIGLRAAQSSLRKSVLADAKQVQKISDLTGVPLKTIKRYPTVEAKDKRLIERAIWVVGRR